MEIGRSGTGKVVLDSHMLSIFTKAEVGTVACIKIPINKIKKVLLRHVLLVFHPKRSILPMSFQNYSNSSSFFVISNWDIIKSVRYPQVRKWYTRETT